MTERQRELEGGRMSAEAENEQLQQALEHLREAVWYALERHHLHGPECLCEAARSTLRAGLALSANQEASQ